MKERLGEWDGRGSLGWVGLFFGGEGKLVFGYGRDLGGVHVEIGSILG